MKTLLTRLAGLLLTGLLLLALGSCTTERFAPGVDARVDSTLTAAGLAPLHVHKLKLSGPVNITVQAGQGNTSTSTTVGTDKRGQRAQAVSTGADSPVSASEKKAGGLPVYVYLGIAVLIAVLAIVGWAWLTRTVNPLSWLPTRAKPG